MILGVLLLLGNQMNYKSLLEELNQLNKDYDQEKKRLKEREHRLLISFCSSRDELKAKIEKVCPHTEERYVDNWHPHTRDGSQYYECKICGRKRYV